MGTIIQLTNEYSNEPGLGIFIQRPQKYIFYILFMSNLEVTCRPPDP